MAEMIFERNAEQESLAIERATAEAEREYYELALYGDAGAAACKHGCFDHCEECPA